jgi:hypothetical protein
MAPGANGILLGKDINSAQSSRLFFSNGTDGQHVAILNSNAGAMDFRTLSTAGSSTGTQRMAIQSTGEVYIAEMLGIAQSSPTARLHAVSSTTQSGMIISGNTSADLVRLTQTGTGNVLVVEDSTNPDSTQFVVNANGAVGIGGAPNASYKLDVIGGTLSAAINTSSTTGDGLVASGGGPGRYGVWASNVGDANGTYVAVYGQAFYADTPYVTSTYIGGNFVADGGGSAKNYSVRLSDGTQGINKLLVDTTGNGDANWTSSINVTSIIASASSTGDIVRITQTGTGNALVVEDSSNPDLTPFVIDASGNIGAGTASPSTKLHVFSTTSGAVRIVDGTQQNGYVLTSDANGIATWQASSGGGTTITNFGDNRIVTSTGTTTGLNGEANLTFDGSTLQATANTTIVPLIIASGSSTQDLVRITQTGTGNAFVVEDSTNPDTTPFIINTSGGVGINVASVGNSYKLYSNGAIYGIGPVGGEPGVTGEKIGDSIGTYIGVKGAVYSDETPDVSNTYIGGQFLALGNNNYSLQLIDGSQGTNKVLVSKTSDGKANWSSDLTLTSIIASASSTSDIVRITQTGTGNALVVEDSTNPDATPFVITSTGNVSIGTQSTNNTLHVQGSMELTGTFSGSNSNFVDANLITQTVLLYMSNNT